MIVDWPITLDLDTVYREGTYTLMVREDGTHFSVFADGSYGDWAPPLLLLPAATL